MITGWLLLALHLAAAPDARAAIEPTDESFAAAAARIGDGWVGFSLPLERSDAPCCWSRSDDGQARVGCDLDRGRHGFVSGAPDLPETDRADVFVHLRGGEPRRAVIVGAHCPVRGGAELIPWVTARDSLALLDRLTAGDDRDVADTALYGIALHAGSSATRKLSDAARGDGPHRLREQALFWLGAARGADGVAELAELLATLPLGELRRHVTVALGQSDAPPAGALLIRLARTDSDPALRADALFWLAQQEHPETEAVATEALAADLGDVREGAVFALSRLPDGRATPALLAVLHGPHPRSVRRRAIFWLAESDDPAAVDALSALLAR